ncbi:MAG: class I SAM-dependent methyltransferase [Actinomycetota bacterium]|nr:class I SAM-dependent methyltransferase [Actinomycetota bacterium]
MSRTPDDFELPPLGGGLLDYVMRHSIGDDPILAELSHVTAERTGGYAGMQLSHESAALLAWLAGLLQPTVAVEIGTFTGTSALAVARALPPGGKLLAFDLSEEWVGIGRPFWERAGVADRIEVTIGPAIDGVSALATERHVGLAFIDADKDGYRAYVEALAPRMVANGVIAVDNTLWGGSVARPDADPEDTNGVALRAFNDWVAADERFDSMILPLGDGLTLIRVR